MGKMLVVVDSENKVSALRAQLDGDFELFVVDAPPLKVSLRPCPPGGQCDRRKFSFSFAPLDAGKPLLEKLRQYAGSEVYLAFERDQRGEFMSWLVAKAMELVAPGISPPRRLHLLALHDAELRESFRQVVPIHEDWAIGYHDRAVFDAALGKHVQRLLGTRTGPAGVPLSIPCLAILFHLAERENEVKAYGAKPRQRLQVKFSGQEGEALDASLVYAFGVTDDGDLYGVKDIEAAVRLLKDVGYVVDEIEKTEVTIAPPSPYRFVELLEEAFLFYHLSLGETLALVRRLFEGVGFEGDTTGLITTHSVVDVSLSATVKKIRQEAGRQLGEEHLAPEGSVAGGEGFLLPTRPDLDGERLREVLGEKGAYVYEQIRRRALASQMLPAVRERFEVKVKGGEHCFFKAVGNVITSQGHLAVYQGRQNSQLQEMSSLAHLAEGDMLVVEQIVPEPVNTGGSQFYSVDSLFADLADFSIEAGPASVALLHQLVEGKYVEILAGGELRCLENAHKVVSTFARAFPSMQGINLSAYLEQTVVEVLSGRKTLDVALRQFDQAMVMKGNVLRKVAVPTQVQPRLRSKRKSQSIIKGGSVLPSVRSQQVAAPAAEPVPPPVPDVEPLEEPLVVTGEVASVASEEQLAERESVVVEEGAADGEVVEDEVAAVVEKDAVEGASETESPVDIEEVAETAEAEEPLVVVEEVSSADLALEGLDDLAVPVSPPGAAEALPEAAEVFDQAPAVPATETLPLPEERLPVAGEEDKGSGVECPVCHKGRILHKKTPIGKPFFVCPREECDFMAWATPHPLPCQICDSLFLVEKKDLHGRQFLRCPKAGCNYRQPMPGDDGAALLAGEQEAGKKKKVLVRRVAKGTATGGKKRKVLVRRRK